MPGNKVCSACRKAKPRSDFNRHRRQPDGYQPECRECSKAGKVRWRAENPERVRHYEAKIRNPVKQACRRVFRAAMARGKLLRPAACTRCGKRGKPQGHHPDYGRPLHVLWLCRLCHEQEHKHTRLGPRIARG